MATYVYRCPGCDLFEVVQPMAAVTATHECPGCGAFGARVFTPPALATTPAAVHRAADAAAASAEAPTVVRSIPAGAPRPRQPRWSPFTGARAINAASRRPGPHPSLPRL